MADWQALGEVQYRKWSIYEEMLWTTKGQGSLNIEDFKIFGSQFGGPLALLRCTGSAPGSELEIQNVPITPAAAASSSSAGGNLKETILIFTAAGRKIAEIEWENKCKSSGIGWSDQEQLIAVLEDGNVLIYGTYFCN